MSNISRICPWISLIMNYTESILARYKNNRTKASDVLGITSRGCAGFWSPNG